MAYGCNDPLRFAKQAEAEAIMQGYMMPGTGLNGCNSLFWNPYMSPSCNSVFNTPYYGTPACGAVPPQGVVAPNGVAQPQGVNAAGDAFVREGQVDQADDGKISFGQKIKSFGKGIISPITNMFKSPANFLKGALGIAAGAGLIAITGGAAAPIMVAAGVGLGGVQIVKGAAGAMSAKTDAEAQKAWENMGSGTFAVAGSIAGAKAAVKASGGNTTGMNALKATKECFTRGFSKSNLTNAWTTAKTNVAGFFKGKGTGAGNGKANPTEKNELGDTTEEIIENSKKQIEDGGNYGEIKKEATRNNTHTEKKEIKEGLKEAHNERRAREKASESVVQKDTKDITDAVGESKTLKQKANKVETADEVSALEEQVKTNQAQRNKELAEIHEEHLKQNKELGQGSEEYGGLTHKQAKRERVMENKNIEAAKNEARAIEKAKENLNKTETSELLKHRKTRDSIKDFQRKGKTKTELEKIANSTHANKFQKAAAQKLLSEIGEETSKFSFQA